MISMTIEGVDQVRAKLRNFIKYSQSESSAITHQHAAILLEMVKRNASGRPGPNVITGVYRDSIAIIKTSTYESTVGTSAPQAMRLEYGFSGTDGAGRIYDQPAFPHFTPAKDIIAPQFKQAMQQAVRSWWR